MLGKGHGGLYLQIRKKEERGRLKGEEIRSNLFIFDLKGVKFWVAGKEEEDKAFHKLHVLEMH